MSRPFASESVYRAIADPTRRRILDLLRDGDLSPTELARSFRHSRPTMSHHLHILRDAGLVSQRRVGRQRMYRAHVQALRIVAAWLKSHDFGERN